MKDRIKGFISGIVLMTFIFGMTMTGFALTGTIKADITFKDIKVYVDNILVDLRDSAGNKVEPFVYKGSTYLPVRAVAEAVGEEVSWNSQTNSVYIGAIDTSTENVTNVETVVSNLKDLLSVGENIKKPNTLEEFKQVFLYNISNGNIDIKSNIASGTVGTKLKEIEAAFTVISVEYPEYFSAIKEYLIKYAEKGTSFDITFKSGQQNISIADMQLKFFEKGKNVIATLKSDGKIKDDMSQKEVAKVLFEYVAKNTKYDTNFTKNPLSFSGYGAAVDGLAVCQGYTAYYNLLCKLVGIESFGIAGVADGSIDHMWTIANLDGKWMHIDVTYGDPVPDRANYVNFEYFAKDSTFMKKTRTWNYSEYTKYGL